VDDEPGDIINVRAGAERKCLIKELVDRGEYKTVSEFVNEALDEKLNRSQNTTRLKRQIFDLIKNDPDIRRELGL